jgi:argininosuccinate synthase
MNGALMRERVVLAYSGDLASSAAIPWLAETHGVDVITVTLDIGQGRDLAELRARALACGAVRAHAIDARDDFARDVLLPSLHTRGGTDPHHQIATLPRPFIARTLVEIAGVEAARIVAHASRDQALDEEVHAIAPALRVLAPARAWNMPADALLEYIRQHGLPVPIVRSPYAIDQHLWGRTLTWEADHEPPRLTPQLAEAALVQIHFEQGVPTAVNGVPMAPAELIECLSLIGEQHGIGRIDRPAEPGASTRVVIDAPAAIVLQAAAAAAGGPATADVCLKLEDGRCIVLAPHERPPFAVSLA